MGEYRAFIIGSDGHVVLGHAFEAADDAAAVEAARLFMSSNAIEIWQLGRRVAILDTDAGKSAASPSAS